MNARSMAPQCTRSDSNGLTEPLKSASDLLVFVERVTRIELAFSAWEKAYVLRPLTRVFAAQNGALYTSGTRRRGHSGTTRVHHGHVEIGRTISLGVLSFSS
jgi:hypothetical protein